MGRRCGATAQYRRVWWGALSFPALLEWFIFSRFWPSVPGLCRWSFSSLPSCCCAAEDEVVGQASSLPPSLSLLPFSPLPRSSRPTGGIAGEGLGVRLPLPLARSSPLEAAGGGN